MKGKRLESKGMGLLFLMTVWVIWRGDREWIAVLGAAALHEGGHLLAARLCGVRVKGFRFGILGARMALDGLLPYGKEFFIAAGGPLINLLCAGGMWLESGGGFTEGGELFFYASLGLGLLNLIPVSTMDGGHMLSAAVSRFFSPSAGVKCIGVTTALCLGGLWLLTVYGLLRGAPMVFLSLFFLFLLLRSSMSA